MKLINNQISRFLSAGFQIGQIGFWMLFISVFCYSQAQYPQTQPPQQQQQVVYSQQTNQTNGGSANIYDNNYSASTPFKTEIARLDASVYRSGKDPLPLMEVPRLNEGDVLKIKLANEPVNGIMPSQSNLDWTLLVAFINPSKSPDKNNTVSEEVRLKDSGWYKDYFFKVPYDSQPIIFLYPKGNYRNKILDLIQKKPDEIRQMSEKVIEISGAYAQLSSFLSQLQSLMSKNSGSHNGYYGNSYGDYAYGNKKGTDSYIEQSVEGLAKSFNVQLPECWTTMAYSPMAARAQCVSKNIRLEDLNFSVTQMLIQGGLFGINRLTKAYPQLSKWIALAAVAIDFILKMTGRVGIKIIPTIVSSPDNPLYLQNVYSQNNQQIGSQNNSSAVAAGNPTRLSLYANSQPNTREYVTVYAFVPHKWQPDAEPEVHKILTPQMNEPCLHTGKNILGNSDLRLEWLADNFTKDFKLVLSDKNGWTKEFDLKKNLGLNAWEAEISKEDLALFPKTSVPLDAKVTGKRGFAEIQSEAFSIPVSNGAIWESAIKPASENKKLVTLRKISGDPRCSQNIIFKPALGQQVVFPIVKDNSFLKFSEDGNIISFEVDSANPHSTGDVIQIQLFGGETIPVEIKP